MGGHNGTSTGGKGVACAFMDRLDLLTTAVYPHDSMQEDQEEEDEEALRFSVESPAALLPVLAGVAKLAMHILRPYLMVGLFALAGLGFATTFCITAGLALLAYLYLFDKWFGEAVLGKPMTTSPGLHCRRSPRTEAVVSMVPALQFPHYKGTPWIVGGDLATVYPFLAFRIPSVSYIRRWLSVDSDDTRRNVRDESCSSGDGVVVDDSSLDGFVDGAANGNAAAAACAAAVADDEGEGEKVGSCTSKEAVALDIALPEAGLDPSKPFYIVLHGLNGGSAEAYVLDFVQHAVKRGCGVCVMVARGCMNTPVRGTNLFHGARISDVRASVDAVRRSLPEATPLAMVGYSMGGIVAANYAAISGANSGLDCCVSMSGSFDTRTNMLSKHSLHVWQPMLALSLKENFVLNHTRKIASRGVELSRIERCKNVVEFDTDMVAPYNGYPSVTDYYVDMSAGADGKIAGLRTPLLAVSALDDPIMLADGASMEELVETPDLFILLTKSGGHVGWPTGWFPARNKWSWMSTTSLDFCEAAIATASL